MFHLPEIPFNELDAFLFASAAIVLGVVSLYRFVRSEVRSRTCDFCGVRIHPEEHAQHVTVCALKLMLRRELLDRQFHKD